MHTGKIIKSSKEIGSMRKSGKILSSILSHLIEIAKPGITTSYLDKVAEEMIIQQGGIPCFKGYHGYPATLCTAVNNEVVHTFPSDKSLKQGDILTLDCGVAFEGYNTDSAITISIGKADEKTQAFIDHVQEVLYEAIRMVKPGVKTGDIGYHIQKRIESKGYHVIKELIGHGIGRELHEEPQFPNFGRPGKGISLKPGMTFCIEPIVGYTTRLIDTLDDNWCIVTRDGGLACQQEHTILVTESGYEVLTIRDGEKI